MFKKTIDIFLKSIVIFLLLSGFVDLSIFFKDHVYNSFFHNKRWLTPPSIANEIKLTTLPGIGLVPKPLSIAKMQIGEDGRRGPRPQHPEMIRHRYLITGASQAFGYYASDDILFTTLLQNRHSTWEILNYATPGEQIISSRNRLSYIAHKERNIERVLLLGGNVDVYAICINRFDSSDFNGTELSFQRLYYIVKRHLLPPPRPKSDCSDPEIAQLAARGIYDDMLSFLATADRLGIEAQIVLPPSYATHPSNMRSIADNPKLVEHNNSYLKPILALRSLIAQGDERRIIDLSTSFDDIEAPFFDRQSHFNAVGHKLMADSLEKILQSPIDEK